MLEVTQQPRQSVFAWPGWRFEFVWRSDRWQHVLFQAQPQGWQPVLESVEGTAEQPWPASPAFQNAYIERQSPTCAEVQLLGQAGKNHYSAAIRCDAAENMIEFDMAVRIHAEPAAPLLMSAYHAAPPLPGRTCDWTLTPETLPGQPPIVSDWTPGSSTATNLTLSMVDLSALKMEKQRATLRWKYRIAVTPLTD